MSVSGKNSQDSTQLGDYRVGKLVSEGARTRTFEAEQISVRRLVLLERLKSGGEADSEAVDAFLADVRAKAAVDHPVIGSVYEATRNDAGVFYTRELLRGRTFEEMHDAGEQLEPRRLAGLLGQIGEALHYLEEQRLARLGLELRHLVLSPHDVVRMANLAVAGDPDPVAESHDRHLVSELLLDLLAVGRPGSTRLRKLLVMLGESEPPGWFQVGHTAKKLANELMDGAKSDTQPAEPAPAPEPVPEAGPGGWIPILLSVLVLGILATGGIFLLKREGVPKARALGGMIRVTGAKTTGPEGAVTLIPAYWIDAHEVTIAEYAEFLDALAVISEDQRDVYDHRDQPSDKTGHQPDDWAALLAAAKGAGTWHDRPVTLNCPVVNVDWWDAYAYANWRGGRLPTLEEWLAAAEGGAPRVSGWGEVDAAEADTTPKGIHGLAGNVREWVRDPGVNPAFPMNPKTPMACGASYLQPRAGILASSWLDSRDVRQPDLGFRIVRQDAPAAR